MKFLFFFFLFGTLQAEEMQQQWKASAPPGFEVTVSYSTEPITLTDLFPVHLNLRYPANYKISRQQLIHALLRHAGYGIAAFTLDHVDENNGAPEKDTIESEWTFWLDPQTVGLQKFSFWSIVFHPDKGEDVEVLSDVFSIEVKKTSKNPPEPMIAPLLTLTQVLPIDLSSDNRRKYLLNPELEKEEAQRNVQIVSEHEFSWWGLLFLLAGLLLAVFPARKKPQNIERQQVIQQIEAKDFALQHLQALGETLNQKSAEDLLPFYDELTQILRTYIEKIYQVPTDARTTEEFLYGMSVHPIFDTSTQEALKEILQSGDKVKFGHETTTLSSAQHTLELTRKFIEA